MKYDIKGCLNFSTTSSEVNFVTEAKDAHDARLIFFKKLIEQLKIPKESQSGVWQQIKKLMVLKASKVNEERHQCALCKKYFNESDMDLGYGSWVCRSCE